MNESFSDVWGEFVDLTNGDGNDSAGVRWLMGEDSSVGAIRNMADPPTFGDPDRIGSPYYYTGAGDNGGVHWNSGVNNKAVYLITDGGTFNGRTVTGLGITKASKIYYEVQTNLLTSGSDYADLYNALYQGCLNLVGTSGITSSDCQEVRKATLAVEMNQEPYSGYNPDAEVCSAGVNPADVFFDNFESGFANWTLGAISGTNFWTTTDPWGPNAHSGTNDLYADDYYTSSNAYARMTNAVYIPANAYLHFYHYFDLESGYDGGVIEYSTDGVNWYDASSMIDSGKNYVSHVGALGRTGFTSASRGYVSTRLNLSSLAGQNVRFRWRMATDGSVYRWGWWLDDVRIYTCPSHRVYLPLVMKDYSGAATPGWETIVNTDFEGDFPGPWQVSGSNGYQWGKRTCRPYAGSFSGWGVGGGTNGSGLTCGSSYPNNASSWMEYGPFSLVGATAGDLNFKLWLNSEPVYDYVCRGASINGTNFYVTCTSGNTGGWIDRTLDLTNVPTLGNLMGQPSVWVVLIFYSDSSVTYTEGGYVDDIVLRKCPSGGTCPAGSSAVLPGAGKIVETPMQMTLPK
ncbi:MAG: M4 family metallopeptidase [Anaerolineales bacterium]|nr:M4 family metallopeptidase [Anaerolineales bacterium]